MIQLPKRWPPKRQRAAAVDEHRTIRIGREYWRASVGKPNEWPETPIAGKEYVYFERHAGDRHWLVMAIGEFERLTNYRLRSLIMKLRHETAHHISEDRCA